MATSYSKVGQKRSRPNIPKRKTKNPLEAMMMAQNKMLMNMEGKQQERQNVGGSIEELKSSLGGSIPPGSTLTSGDANIKINRELTQDERSDLDHYATLEKYINGIEEMINKDPNKFQGTFIKAITPGGVGTLGDPEAINLSKWIGDWSDRILRARSKSQTTEKEFGRIKGFGVPTFKDITVTSDPNNPDISYPTFRDQFKGVRESINRGRDMILKGSLSQEYGLNPNQDSTQVDPVEEIKKRFRQRNP